MMKRFLSLLCALALCLGLLPVTALAAEGAPNTLYVGNTDVKRGGNITYWSTNDSGGLTRVENATDNSDDWNVKYDPNTATLTLNGATINGAHDATSAPYGSGIYAPCSSKQPVALTIELIGTNTITGNYGIYVDAQQGETVGTNASLSITGDGSLTVTGTTSYGLYVKSGTGNASLTIKDAPVVASCRSSYGSYAGVCVHSGSDATSSPKLSLAVDVGSLTASGGGNNDGIQFYVGALEATNATTSLIVTDNAIVDAKNGGISAKQISNPINTDISATGSSGGIVFDGTEGTVYGNVTLQEDLEIGEGETLTIPEGSSLTVPDGTTLTNNGTINVESGGNLEGEPTSGTGTVVSAPKITTESLASGTVGAAYSQALQADNAPTLWSITSGSLPDGLNLSGSTISGTPTTAGTSTFTVKAENSAGSDSKAYTLTIQSATVPVTGVKLDTETLELFTGGSATLTAAVQPSDAANQNVTWQSDNANVATVQNGTVTAVGAGEATITVQTQDGNYTATCKVTVTQSTYSISADTTALNFGSVYTGYAQPAAKTVTITNTGNRPQPLTLTASTGSFEVGTLTKTQLAAGEKATFTVQPKAGLAVGTYSEDIAVSGTGDAAVTIAATFTVRRYVPPAPAKTPSQQALDKIGAADDGDTVTVSLSAGDTVLDAEVFEALAGKDVTLVVAVPGGVTWAVSGQDIPKNAKLSDLDLGVSLGGGIPADVINAVTGEAGTVQLSLAHDGAFGFEMTLTAPLGEGRAGLWANLYHYDEGTGRLVFQSAATVGADGRASFALSHASEWAVVVDSASHELPFSDVAPADWFANPVGEAYRAGVMTGYGDGSGLFGPDDELTRAQAAAVLFRALGQEAQAPSCGMTDVDQDAWYAGAVDWAVHSGLMRGYGDGSGPFGPDDALSREQLATVLWRAAGEPDAGAFDPSAFSDGGEASEWAEPALAWAMASGVLQGSDDGDGGVELRPGAAVTRAEMAAMVSRWLAVG